MFGGFLVNLKSNRFFDDLKHDHHSVRNAAATIADCHHGLAGKSLDYLPDMLRFGTLNDKNLAAVRFGDGIDMCNLNGPPVCQFAANDVFKGRSQIAASQNGDAHGSGGGAGRPLDESGEIENESSLHMCFHVGVGGGVRDGDSSKGDGQNRHDDDYTQ